MGELETDKNDDDDDIVKTIRKNLKEHAAHYRSWRTKARESYDFVASKQWSDEDEKILNDQGRPAVVFNRVARTVNAVVGLELQNRQEVNYKPIVVDGQGRGVNDLMNSAAKWTRSNCDAEDEESEAYQDTIICGIGCTETLMDYSVDPDGMAIVERCDPFEVAADHRAKKRNFDDAKWVARWKCYSKEEFESLYPGIEVEGKDINLWTDDADELHGHADDEYNYESSAEEGSQKEDSYTVIKYQYFEDECYYRVPSQGNLVELTESEYEAIKPYLDQVGIKAIKQNKRVYKQCIVCRDTILEESAAPVDAFSIRFITGIRDRNRNIWFGIVELMKDPQRWANKWLSQIQYILNTNAKGGLLFETGAFANPKKAKAEWSKPDAWTELTKGALVEGKLQQKQPPAYPDGIDRLLSQALTAINDVPGVNVELLGVADRNQPGIVEDGRKNAGVTILSIFTDSFRRYHKEQGRVLMQFIINYISDGRLIRLDKTNSKYVPLLKDGLAAKYDILVDDSPTSPNMKEKVFATVSSMLQIALQAGIPIPPEILEYSPLPAALVEKWMALIEEQKQNPENQKKAQQADAAFNSNLKKVESETIKNQTQAQLNAAKMQKELDPSTYGASEMDVKVEQVKAGAAVVKAQAEIQKTQLQIKNELIKSAMGMHRAAQTVIKPTENL